jgi:genome maintenance exonuclease 1
VKRGRRKKKAKDGDVSTQASVSSSPSELGPFCGYSFFGTSEKTEEDCPNCPISLDAQSVVINEGRYYVYQSPDLTMELPSVTTVLSETQALGSYFALKKWRQSIEDSYGQGSFHHYREKLLHRGTLFHKMLEERLSGRAEAPEREEGLLETPGGSGVPGLADEGTAAGIQHESEIDQIEMDHNPHLLYRSVSNVLSDISDVAALESVVTHLDLGYMGRVDCIAKYRGKLSVIDWKTSHKPRPNLKDMYDGPTQLVAYAGAINSDKQYPFKVRNVALVAVYDSGEPCDVHVISEEECLHHWEKWLERLATFKTQFAHDLSTVY